MKLDFDFKDLDKWENFYKLYKAIHELKLVGKVEIKETYKGYHVYASYVTDPDKELNLRYYFGDDPIRIAYDEERLRQAPHLFDVLYRHKITGKVVATRKGLLILTDEKYDEVQVNE